MAARCVLSASARRRPRLRNTRVRNPRVSARRAAILSVRKGAISRIVARPPAAAAVIAVDIAARAISRSGLSEIVNHAVATTGQDRRAAKAVNAPSVIAMQGHLVVTILVLPAAAKAVRSASMTGRPASLTTGRRAVTEIVPLHAVAIAVHHAPGNDPSVTNRLAAQAVLAESPLAVVPAGSAASRAGSSPAGVRAAADPVAVDSNRAVRAAKAD